VAAGPVSSGPAEPHQQNLELAQRSALLSARVGLIGVLDARISKMSEGAKADRRGDFISRRAQIIDAFSRVKVYITEETAGSLAVALARLKSGRNFTIWLRGPSGYGKTTIPKTFASIHGLGIVFVNCAVITDPEEWFYIRALRGSETVLEPTPLANALEAGGAVIVLDEINRAQPWVLNPLLSILDDSRRITIAGRELRVGEGLVVFFTSNEGSQFVGTTELDPALTNRVESAIVVSAPDARVEAQIVTDTGVTDPKEAARIASTIRQIRSAVEAAAIQVDVSTRVLVKVTRQVLDGMTLFEACVSAIVNTAPMDSRRAVFDIIKLKVPSD
jgi:MoxR-like ATPase